MKDSLLRSQSELFKNTIHWGDVPSLEGVLEGLRTEVEDFSLFDLFSSEHRFFEA